LTSRFRSLKPAVYTFSAGLHEMFELYMFSVQCAHIIVIDGFPQASIFFGSVQPHQSLALVTDLGIEYPNLREHRAETAAFR